MLPGKSRNKINPALSFHLMKFAILDYQKNSCELSEKEYFHAYQRASEEMLLHQLILSSDEARYVVIPEPVLQKTLWTIIADYQGEVDFHALLRENGLRFRDYRRALRNDLMVETILTQVASSVQSISPVEILQYFRSHRDSFILPERRSVDHVLFLSDPTSSTLTDQALKQATALHHKLCQNPDNFSEVANRYGQSSRTTGGDLGPIIAGELCEELDRVLFSMAAGEISPVIVSSSGFHLLYCREIHQATPMSFAEAAPKIFSILLKKKQLAACRAWLKSLVQPN